VTGLTTRHVVDFKIIAKTVKLNSQNVTNYSSEIESYYAVVPYPQRVAD
jgi:hypothetical protein